MASGPFDLSSLGVDSSVVPQRKFPQTKDLFAQDDRVSYDQAGEKWILEDRDGTKWEFNESVHRWTSLVDDEDIARFQAGYVWKENPDAVYNKKRKNSEDLGAQPKRTRNGRAESEDPTNNAIYLKNLPLDTNERELAQFAAIAGLLEEDLSTGEPRVKLYRDKHGELKGDGIAYYHKPESVYLAIDVLDGRAYRAIRPFENEVDVSQADFETYKGKKDRKKKAKKDKTEKPETEQQISSTDWGRALRQSKTKLNNMLTDWGDEDPSAIIDADSRDFKFVLLFNLFTVEHMMDHPRLAEVIQKQIHKRCKKYGDVQRVVVFDREPAGVVRVRFSAPEEAQACAIGLQGKIKNGPPEDEIVVEVRLSDGKENFRKARLPPTRVKRAETPVDGEQVDVHDEAGEGEASTLAADRNTVDSDQEAESPRDRGYRSSRNVEAAAEGFDDKDSIDDSGNDMDADLDEATDANGKDGNDKNANDDEAFADNKPDG